MWTEVCKNCWNLFRFWWHQVFSITSLSVFWCVLWTCLYSLDIGFCNIGWGDLPLKCNFSCYVFASSSLSLPKVVMKYLFEYFWKPIILFSNFCVNCLLRFHFVYCNNCVLKDFNGARWCTWSTWLLVQLRVPERCFRPAKTKKTWTFWDAYMSLTRCSNIVQT